MIRPLDNSSQGKEWLGAFSRDFDRRFLELLSFEFREFPSVLALSIDESANMGSKLDSSYQAKPLSRADLDALLSPFDLKRLESYANNMLDYHVILDLVPRLALLYFTERLKSSIKLTGIQSSILLAVGLQRKDLTAIEKELSLPSSQLLAMFIKIMRKMSAHLNSLVSGAIEAELPTREAIGVSREDADGAFDDEVINNQFEPLETGLDDELEEGGDAAMKELREKQRQLIDALPLDQ
jgi:N-acetyltransferase 10